ncbi:MAG: hypothetical protein J6A92_03510 [Lachnospiraceae bacterium]|nr:hypothetical protein [Lachnospiraceae bacterium]
MVGRIIALVSCIMCAVPFFIISTYGKDSFEPINFWSGDTTLKSKVKNIREYNENMAEMYKKCAVAFLFTGIGFVVVPILGIVMLCLDCTVGIFVVYRKYKKILSRYS